MNKTITIDGVEYVVTRDNFSDLASARVASRERQLGRQLDSAERGVILRALQNLAYSGATGPVDRNENLGGRLIEARRKEAPFLTGVADAAVRTGELAAAVPELPGKAAGLFDKALDSIADLIVGAGLATRRTAEGLALAAVVALAGIAVGALKR